MNFSGTIDETNGMTMTRLIERIVHTDTPGELRLHDDASGRKATVAIRRGMVEEVSFGEIQGDPALTAISQVMPWTFEFVADEAGAVPSHPSMISRRPKARAVVKASGPAAPQSPIPPTTPPSSNYTTWLAEAPGDYCIHFARLSGSFSGAVMEDDYAYLNSDFEFMKVMATRIAQTLGWGAPDVFAVSEAERSSSYAPVPEGFLGVIGGAGTGIEHVIHFPPTPAAND